MNHFAKFHIAFYFFAGLPLTVLAQANADSPCAVFGQQVERKNLADGAGKWGNLAKAIAADPLAAQLGLDKLAYGAGNRVSYDFDLKIGDDELELEGDLYFDPEPAAGAPAATLRAKTQSRTRTDLVELGALRATAAELHAALYKETGGYKLYARLVPYFADHNKEPRPCIMLSKGKEGVDFAVTGGGLLLKELYPAAGKVKFFDQFALKGVAKQGKEIDVLGAVNGKDLKAEFENGRDYLLVTGQDLVLSDFIPEAGAAPFLDGFSFESLELAGGTMTVNGLQNGKKVSVWRGADKKSFAVEGDDLKLEDFIPAAAKVPCVNGLALDSVVNRDGQLAITGKLGGKAVAAAAYPAENRLELSGPALSLPACLPAFDLPFFKFFSFGGLFSWPDRLEIDGTVNGKDVKLVWIFAPNTVTVTGESLRLDDFIPEAAKVPTLKGFAFLSLEYSKASTRVQGTVSGKAISVTQSNADKTFTITGDKLTLADFIPETAGLTYLDRFTLSKVQRRSGGVSVAGAVDGKAVTVDNDEAAKAFTITGESLKLADFVPEAAQVPFLQVFAATSVRSSPDEFLVTGKAGAKAVTVDDHLSSNIFTVTGAGLTLQDFFPAAAEVPALNAFAFERFTHTADAVAAAGRVNNKAVSVQSGPGTGEFTVKGDALKLADFVPAAAKVPYLANYAFLSLTRSEAQLRVDGTVNGKNAAVTLDKAAKTYTVTGSALQLADFVPDAAKLPYLARFDLTKVQERPDGVLVIGDVDGKAVSVEYFRATASFKVTGDGLQLKDFIPQAAGVAYLDNFKFDSLAYAASVLTVTGRINDKAVTVKKTLGAPDFSVTGDSLTLADFIPGADQVPCVSAFALDSVRRSDAELGIAGKVGGKPVSITDYIAENRVQMTGPGLSLPACLPLSLNIPFLKLFSFGALFSWPDRLEVDGTVNGKDVKVVWVFAPDTVTVTGDSIKLADVLPSTARLPFLNSFAFLELDYSKAETSVSGTVTGKNVTVTKDNASESLKVTGDDLKLTDFVPEAAGLPFLKTFAFDALLYTPTAITVNGTINFKAVAVNKPFGPGAGFTATGEGLTLADIVPEAGGLKAFDKLALDLVSVSPAEVKVAGKLGGKAVAFSRTRGDKPVSTITADGLTLGDIYAPLAALPAVNAVSMDKLSLDGSSVEAEARLNGVKVAVAAHADAGDSGAYTAIFFDTLSAGTFIPAAQGHVVNELALEKALFVVQPAGSQPRTLAAADLPGSLARLAGWGGGDSLPLAEGVNFAAWLNVGKSGSLGAAFRTAGLPPASVLLKGTVSQNTFKGMTGKSQTAAASLQEADKQALLAGLNLSVPVPLPPLPALAGMVTVRGPAILSIGGDARSKSSLWARVPAAIAASKPAGDLDVSLQFGLDVTGAGINEKLDALVSLDKGARAGYSLLAVYEGAWKQPFGIQGLTLDNGGFEFSLEKSADASKSGLGFFATALIGQKSVAVTAQLKRENGKLSLEYFELDGKFRPGDFPGGKNIPYGDKFELDQLKLSPRGIEAKTVIAGKKVDAYLFDAGAAGAPNWIFAAAQKNFSVAELLPAARAIKPLAAMTIPDAALIVSEKGLKNADRASLGVIAKGLFDRVLGKSAVKINVPDGISVLAGFDADAMGPVGKGLRGIGVHDDALVMGAVTGVFAGNPGVMLSITMESGGDPKGLPKKVVSFRPGVPPSYFIQWSGTELDAGLKAPLVVRAGKETLNMDADLELKFADSGVGVKVLAAMDGTWRQPFGIKGLILKNVKLDLAVNETGEVQLGFAGDQLFGRCSNPKSQDCLDLDMAMSVKIPLEDGLPDGVAFAGKTPRLGLAQLLDITEGLTGAPAGSLLAQPAPFFEIKDAQLAFATPGASDPQLGLVGEGFAFAGTFVFMNRELGRVKGSGGPSGTAVKGTIGDIDLEIIKFTGNSIDFALGAKPRYAIDSSVNLLGAPQKVKLDIEPPYFEFDLTEKLGAFGNALLTVRMDGFDLKKGTFDKNAGISVTGVFKSTLIPWMKDEVKKGVEELRDSARAKFDEDTKALEEAKAKVNEINDKIEKIKKEDQKAKDRAEEALESARRRVNSLQDKYDHEEHQAHHCGSRWTHWACSPGWRVAAAATWVVKEVADEALRAAEKAVAAASNLDPRIAVLIAQRDIERAALSVAESVVKVTEDIEDFVLKELETVLERAVSNMPLEIDEAVIVGDLRDMVTHNEPMVLDLKFKLAGAPMHEFFAVKVPDSPENAEFDSTSFALLPALALDTLTEEALKKLSADAARWVHSHIAVSLAAANEKVRAQVEAEEEKYAQVLASFDNGTAKYRKAFEEQTDEHLSLVQAYQVSDTMPDSLEYSNIYLAIGHSDHCLGVSKDGLSVVQMVCKDADTEMWSTVRLDTDTAKGYVQLKNKGLCLKARNGDKADNFEPLTLATCDGTDRHEQWKIHSSDGFYDEIVNRFAQKCLHFNKEDANPETAYAVWAGCYGADSQTFRDITDAEKPTWHKVNSLVEAGNGLCLDVAEDAENAAAVTPDKKELKLLAHKCGDGSERFNFIEEVNGDIRLVHVETGLCVYPQENAQTLALRACDRGADMFWRLNDVAGAADQFFNPARNSCMILPAPPKGVTQDAQAGLADCKAVPNDATLMDFVK